jgi:hypothetical protein
MPGVRKIDRYQLSEFEIVLGASVMVCFQTWLVWLQNCRRLAVEVVLVCKNGASEFNLITLEQLVSKYCGGR